MAHDHPSHSPVQAAPSATAPDPHGAEAVRKHLSIYIGVFLALLVGTALTVGASYIKLGTAGNVALALFIATIKAFLVAGFFMHLVSEKKSIYVVLGFTAVFFVALMYLTIWSMEPNNIPHIPHVP